MPPAIEVTGLRKQYDDGFVAVDGISLSVEPGEVFCLLGPNGAGKTTTTEILEGYRHRTSGEVRVLGFDPGIGKGSGALEFRQRIGIVLQECGIETFLTVTEVLDMYGSFYPKRRPSAELIELVELDAKGDTAIGNLSGGQRRRLDVALALVGDPDLIFLDEPTTGFDPSARRHSWSTIRALADLGKTVFLTTHFMDEAESLATRIAVVRSGRIVAEGTPTTLGGRDHASSTITVTISSTTEIPDFGTIHVDIERVGHDLTIRTQQPVEATHRLTGWALTSGIALDNLSVHQPSLEDIYLQLTAAEEVTA